MQKHLMDITRIVNVLLVGWLLMFSQNVKAQSAYQLLISTSMRTNYVRSLVQDKYGYVWMGTTTGLGRYDGYETEVFKPARQGNRQLLHDIRILNLKYWLNRFIWIRTRGNKYSCYDIDRERFVDYTGNGTYDQPLKGCSFLRNGELMVWREKEALRISFDGQSFKSNPVKFPTFNVVDIVDTPEGEYLVLADGNIYRRRGNKYVMDYSAFLSKTISKISEVAYHHGTLFLSTNAGVYEYRLASHKMQVSTCNPPNAYVVSDNLGNVIILSYDGKDVYYMTAHKTYHFCGIYNAHLLQQDSDPRYTFITSPSGKLWITTYGNGLFSYEPSDGKLTSYIDMLPSPYIMSAMEDKEGNLWVSMENMGVSVVVTQQSEVHYIYNDIPQKVSHANDIRLLKLVGRSVYIADMQNGFYMSDSLLDNRRSFTRFKDDVTAVCKDVQGRLWVGTRKKGVFVDGKPLVSPGDGLDARTYKVSDFLEDKRGRMWISFFGRGLAVCQQGKLVHVLNDKDLHLRAMTMDKQGWIYLCSDNGTLYFNPDKLIHNPKDYKLITVFNQEEVMGVSHCVCAYIDSKQRVWIGTMGNGLKMINGKDTLIYTTHNGLADNNVASVVEDQKTGDIWVGTEHGVSRWRNGKFTNFYFGDNELANFCSENSAICLSDGRIAFGTHLGVMTFFPLKIKERKSPFPLAITKIEVNGMSIAELNEGEWGEYALVKTKEVTLGYNQNSLTFYFSDFSYSKKGGSTFSYFLEGYDKAWSGLSHFNFAQYRNLPSGKYTLHVRSCNVNGVWSPDEAVLTVVIRPPFYATWWACLIYIICLFTVLYIVCRTLHRINDLRTAVKVETQLTEYKLRFFTNISHEFRTPLSIIQGDMERMNTVGNIPGDLRQPMASMAKSVRRMMRLVNQLLEFRKMQNDKLTLALERTDVVEFLHEIFLNFKSVAEDKRINYMFLPFDRNLEMYVDRNYLDKIAYNLLSNALKYTPTKGEVILRISQDQVGHRVVISVEDSGIGVEKEKQQHLFERFNRSSYLHDSIGIGLHLTAELVRLHHGEISYLENNPQGSIFRVELPLDETIYQPSDFMQVDSVLVQEDKEKQRLADYKSMQVTPMNDYEVMVVDDDNDVREFLVGELQRYFHIVSASDGQEAWEKMQTKKPDLLVSDVLMPGMDGFKLVQNIRKDVALADLPIVMLTALTDDRNQSKGIDMGADAYIEKPFSMDLLVGRCCQLLNQRRLLKLFYSQHESAEKIGKIALPEIKKDEKDAKFQRQLDSWLTEHLSDTELNIDLFAEKMGYARTSFYKKIKVITGCTPNEYIRMKRMNKAVELLQDEHVTVAEVAYQVGYADPYYFSKVFKSFFGVSPSVFREGK